ncbi:MAG: T9SS type A sorting domain-containing protein [Bacteroidota bacterium]|jgi:hypothetical protein|nr:T9SS type A sorting domain-containing protein [Bacteroidota bacterium]
MKTATILFLTMLALYPARAQRGDIVIPPGAQITVPAGARICADRIFANNPGFGTLTIAHVTGLCPGMSVVPVELLAFTASVVHGDVHLQWSTASETNCLGFEVQRRIEASGGDWQPLGFVQAAGTSTAPRQYDFTDPAASIPVSAPVRAYRLRIVDFDGSVDYSPDVEVQVNSAMQPYTFHPVYPNPAMDRLHVTFTLPEPSRVTITLYTMTGAVVATLMDEGIIDRGFHTMAVPTTGLRSGTYLIELRTQRGRRTQTVVLLE